METRHLFLMLGVAMIIQHFFTGGPAENLEKDQTSTSNSLDDPTAPSGPQVVKLLQKELRQRGIVAIGENFPPPPSKVKASQLITLIQYSLIALIFFGDAVFSTLGVQPPALYLQARDNKAWSCFLIFMIGNQLAGGLLTTGAFEVYKGNISEKCIEDSRLLCTTMTNSEVLFSKLAEGRFPDMGELIHTITQSVQPFPQ